MKKLNCISLLACLSAASVAQAQRGTLAFPTPPLPPSPPPVLKVWVDPNYQAPDWSAEKTKPASAGEVFVYDQKQYGGHAALVTPEQAQGIMDRFKTAYLKLGSPRFLLYVNRELVNEQSGLKITHGTQHLETTKNSGGATSDWSSVKTSTDQNFRANQTAQPTLADRQTVRDVERLFGRPLRQAGASLVDQKVAAQLIADKPITDFVGTTDTPESRKDREAIGRIADVVIEILISSKTVAVPTISDAQTISIPDIQATAISLKDSKIIGQASSTDVTNRVPPASLGGYGVPEITEATALALMEDLTSEAK